MFQKKAAGKNSVKAKIQIVSKLILDAMWLIVVPAFKENGIFMLGVFFLFS